MAKQKKKRTKKVNHREQFNALARRGLKNHIITHVGSMAHPRILAVSRRKGKAVPVDAIDQIMLDMIYRTPHKWSCYLAAFGRDKDHTDYMEAVSVVTPEPILHDDLKDLLDPVEDDLRAMMDPEDLICLGFLQCPEGRDWDEASASFLFDQLGAWSSLAEWQKTLHGPLLVPERLSMDPIRA